MFYNNELDFLCNVFEKSHLPTIVSKQYEIMDYISSCQIDGVADPYFENGGGIEVIISNMKHQTVYRFTDAFHRRFLCLLLPNTEVNTIFLVGPFLSAQMSQQKLLAMGEELNIPPQKQRYLTEYYDSIPVLSLDSPLITMFNSFCELVWKSPSFAIEEIERESTPLTFSVHKANSVHSPSDILVNIKALEKRYSFENELLRSVSLGQLHMEDRFISAFSVDFFEKRANDPLRNAKNYAIIMNTLLRKAAENGGVHPVYVDQISSDFAHKIESLQSLESCRSFMRDMFRAYCRLVNKYTVNKYSPVVKRTILTIDADLSADLSPGKLAASQGISLGYLSTIFKKEVGKTLSEHIRYRRIEHAKYLLNNTDLQIQTVALHCGILDVQYFTKLFKGHTGMTPSEYRATKRKSKA